MRGEPGLRAGIPADARRIAMLARDLVEHGLGWSWREQRILDAMRGGDDMVLCATVRNRVVGAAVMRFGIDEARLNLLLVAPPWQRAGVGRRLLEWLELSARTAGLSVVFLEVRAGNTVAQAFYRRLGYRVVSCLPDYYAGRETALRMARDLWAALPTDVA
jgi:ribosomal-protein-alanine N-acetyltransferase